MARKQSSNKKIFTIYIKESKILQHFTEDTLIKFLQEFIEEWEIDVANWHDLDECLEGDYNLELF